MKKDIALVTGAAGFIGRSVVRSLRRKGYRVRACVHHPQGLERFSRASDLETICIDILDTAALRAAMRGVDDVYHFAALVKSGASPAQLMKVNVEGSRNVWNCAAAGRVRKALFCSTTAVYGLLAGSHQPITEIVQPRAVEAYGKSKLLAEAAILEIAGRCQVPTVIIRPVAVFGPGENSAFGKELRHALFSKLLFAGGFKNRSFNYVHVEDVADASVHLMERIDSQGQIYNILVENPIFFEQAYEAYLRALDRTGGSFIWPKLLAHASRTIHKIPPLSSLISRLGRPFVFHVWHPGYDVLFSSAKLLATAYRFKWESFEDILLSCAGHQELFPEKG